MKKIVLISLLFISVKAFSQKNKIVCFMADTLSISKENRVLKHGYFDNAFEHFFVFFCKCIPPYKTYVTFSYVIKKEIKNRRWFLIHQSIII